MLKKFTTVFFVVRITRPSMYPWFAKLITKAEKITWMRVSKNGVKWISGYKAISTPIKGSMLASGGK
jgi:hypothetical protein